MPAVQLVRATALREAFQCVFADGAEHQEAGLAIARRHLAQQALLDERTEAIEQVDVQLVPRAHLLDGVQSGAAQEDGEAPEERPFVIGQQLVAPVDRSAQRLLPLRAIAAAAGEKIQPVAQARQHRLGSEDVDPRRGQLDRQGEAVQPRADLRNGGRILVGDAEVRLDCHRPLDEQGDRFVLRQRLDRVVTPRIGCGQRRDRVLTLAVDPQGAAAGGEDA